MTQGSRYQRLQYQEEQAQILALFPRVEFADDHRLLGFNTMCGSRRRRSGPAW
jgi:hypothetical protein